MLLEGSTKIYSSGSDSKLFSLLLSSAMTECLIDLSNFFLSIWLCTYLLVNKNWQSKSKLHQFIPIVSKRFPEEKWVICWLHVCLFLLSVSLNYFTKKKTSFLNTYKTKPTSSATQKYNEWVVPYWPDRHQQTQQHQKGMMISKIDVIISMICGENWRYGRGIARDLNLILLV